MRRFILLIGVAVVAAVVCAASVAAEPRPAVSCTNVSGAVEGVAFPVFDGTTLVGFHVPVTATTGDLGGTTSADLQIVKATQGGTLHVTGSHTWAGTIVGTFQTSDQVVIGPDGTVHDTLTIISGDATGMLTTHGTVDLASGALALVYHGRVCTT